jgi:hypothetical protein
MSNLSDLIPAGGGQNNTDFVADGSITSGKPVILTAAGKAAQVVQTSPPVTFSAGTPVEWNGDADSGGVSIAYDSTNQKVVVSYKNYHFTPSNAGGCIVGTVSGTTTSWGTPVIFSSGTVAHQTSIVFDSTNSKVVIAYRDTGDSNKGKAIVGTVSGTSISYGTAVEFESGATTDIAAAFGNGQVFISYTDAGDSSKMKCIIGTVSGTAISFGSIADSGLSTTLNSIPSYDSTANKFVVAFMDNVASNIGKAVVASVSGTTPSYGTPVTFSSNSVSSDPPPYFGVTYDSEADKTLIAYSDNSDSNKGYGIVATVTGTSLSYGTAVKFNDNGDTDSITSGYDPDAKKIVIIYRDQDTTNDPGTAIEATISGTSVSFGTAIVYQSTNAPFEQAIAYDTTNDKFVAAYSLNTGKGNAAVITTGRDEVTNLTSTNLLGVAAGAISDTATGTINTWGSRNEVQTGLTIASDYYVQSDGTITTTSTSPAQLIGTAISATQINIKDYTG